MNILFMDDSQERHDLAEKYLSKNHTLLHCFNADEALEIVQSFQGVIGLAMLDHDLMDELTGRHEDGTPFEKHGMWFVLSMIDGILPEKYPMRAIVHSYNPSGAKNMCQVLNKFGIDTKQDMFSGAMLQRLVTELTLQ